MALHPLSSLHEVEVIISDSSSTLCQRVYHVTKNTTAVQLLHHILAEPVMADMIAQLQSSLSLSTAYGFVVSAESHAECFSTLCLSHTSDANQLCLALQSDALQPPTQLTLAPSNSPVSWLLKFTALLRGVTPETIKLTANDVIVTMETKSTLNELKERLDKDHPVDYGSELGSVERPMVFRVSQTVVDDSQDEWAIIDDAEMIEVEIENDAGQLVLVSLPPTSTLNQLLSAAESKLGTSATNLSLVVGNHRQPLPSDDTTTVQQLLQPDGSIRLSMAQSSVAIQMGEQRKHLSVAKTTKLSVVLEKMVAELSPGADIAQCSIEINGEEQEIDEDSDPILEEMLQRFGKDAVFVLQVY